MKRQGTSYWCGIASIANALEVLGIKRSQREIARLCHVTPSGGTDETEMMRALLANGVQVDEWSYRSESSSEDWVLNSLEHGPVVACVDDDEHWVTIIGKCGMRFLIFDPSRNMGIEVHDWSSLAKRWVNSSGVYYGLGVSP